MERYFNTLKYDLIYQHYYHSREELYMAVEEFAYVHYNNERKMQKWHSQSYAISRKHFLYYLINAL